MLIVRPPLSPFSSPQCFRGTNSRGGLLHVILPKSTFQPCSFRSDLRSMQVRCASYLTAGTLGETIGGSEGTALVRPEIDIGQLKKEAVSLRLGLLLELGSVVHYFWSLGIASIHPPAVCKPPSEPWIQSVPAEDHPAKAGRNSLFFHSQ
ncbi:hypothetical protein GQ53DRAFT_304998 [Thozetella sp. PMI_491]|nr:hypothetical protein GQ53DRAFT_304998 [Thozetella sp. PMI_491]